MSTKHQITLEQAIAELKAELALRINVYRKWIRDGRMKRESADRKFAAMARALHILLELQSNWREEGNDWDAEEEGLPDEQ